LVWLGSIGSTGTIGAEEGMKFEGSQRRFTDMFGSLNEDVERSPGEKLLSGTTLLRYAGFLVASIVAFGVVYAGIVFMD
jgi:hypothetical protein